MIKFTINFITILQRFTYNIKMGLMFNEWL